MLKSLAFEHIDDRKCARVSAVHFRVILFCLFILFLLVDILSGYNGTIFAYGQTSSGKTHTMEVSEQT